MILRSLVAPSRGAGGYDTHDLFELLSRCALCLDMGEKLKNQMFGQNRVFCSYGDSRGFNTTEMSRDIFCVEIDPGSPIFCFIE